MSEVTLYHNPRCSKSRQPLALLEERGIEPEIIENLKTPPDAATITGLLDKLGIPAIELIRRGEAPFAELPLAGKEDDDGALVEAMVSLPPPQHRRCPQMLAGHSCTNASLRGSPTISGPAHFPCHCQRQSL